MKCRRRVIAVSSAFVVLALPTACSSGEQQQGLIGRTSSPLTTSTAVVPTTSPPPSFPPSTDLPLVPPSPAPPTTALAPTCADFAITGDLVALSSMAVEAINNHDYRAIADCTASPSAVDSLRGAEGDAPFDHPTECAMVDGPDIECWAQNDAGFTISIDVNPGSAREFITGSHTIGGGQ